MIAIDGSAILTIVRNAPEAPWLARMLAENDCIIGAPTHVALEAHFTGHDGALHVLHTLLSWRNVDVVPFTPDHVGAAIECRAMLQRQAATAIPEHKVAAAAPDSPGFLAAPDTLAAIESACMAYAIARIACVPLLFTNSLFLCTDIVPAWNP